MSFSPIFTQIQQQFALTQAVVDEQPLIDLVSKLRPKDSKNLQEIKEKFKEFILFLEKDPHHGTELQIYLLKIITHYKQTTLYSDTGILSLDGFWNQLGQRVMSHFLPPIIDHTQLQDLIARVFHQASDKSWLERIEATDLDKIFVHISGETPASISTAAIRQDILKAMNVVSYRISGIGLFPEIIYAEPKLNEHESPFLAQNREITDFIQQFKYVIEHENEVGVHIPPDASQAFVMIEQCKVVVNNIRRATKRLGVSLTLTYLLTVLEQSLDRLEHLLVLVNNKTVERQHAIRDLLYDFVRANYNERSVKALLTTNSELLAFQVTENASKTGENYVSTDKKGFFSMYKAAAGAGSIIACMSIIKILLARLTLAPIVQAIAFSLNYGLGFVFIHILHFTVATKQPAMTAAALAATVQQRKGSRTAQLAELTQLIVNIIRTQFIAILGNISIAIPVAGLLTVLWPTLFGEHLISNAKASYLLHSIDPFSSLAIPHAAIAGVGLFLSGLIAGYFDNMAIYRKIGPRIKNHRGLRKILGEKYQIKFADYMECNLGAISGNFLFGFMLGSMGTIGFILGLPLDIRHIAFASANLIQGLLSLDGTPDIGLVLVSCLGVLLIGLTNLFVSFTLTILMALRARRIRFDQWRPLAKLVMTHFITRPSDFFWPPKNEINVNKIQKKEH